MFNYSEIDKHITVYDLAIIAAWLVSKDHGDYMVSRIEREKGKRIYNIHLTDAGTGFNRKVSINENNEVEVVEKEKQYFWMS